MSNIKAFFVHIPRAVYIIFFLALFIRLFVFGFLYSYSGEASLMWSDSTRYNAIAEHLLAGDGYYYKGGPEAYRPPGYPLYFVLIHGLHMPLWLGSVLQIIVSSLIPVFIYGLARRAVNLSKKYSFVVALLTVFEPNLIYYSVPLLPDTFFAAFFLAGFYCLWKWFDAQQVRYMIWAGILIGLSNYIRPAGLYFSIALAIFFTLYILIKRIDMKKIWHVVLLVVSILVIMAPWYVRNYIEFGKVGFVTSSTYNLYIYGAVATEALSSGQSFEEVNNRFLTNLKDRTPEGHGRWSFVNETYMRTVSKEVILAHPVVFAKVYALGLNTFLFSGNYHFLLSKYDLISVPERISFSLYLAQHGFVQTFVKVLSVASSPYFFLALVGKIGWVILILGSLVGAWMYRKNPLALLFFVSMTYFCFTIVSVTMGAESRHRYMLNPLIFLFFVAMISRIEQSYTERKNKRI